MNSHSKNIKIHQTANQNPSKFHQNPSKIHPKHMENPSKGMQNLSKPIQNPSKSIQKWFWNLFCRHSDSGDKYVDLPTNTTLSKPTAQKLHQSSIQVLSKPNQNPSNSHSKPIKLNPQSIQHSPKTIQNPSKSIQKWFWHLCGRHSNCGAKYVDLHANTALSEPKTQKIHQTSIQILSNIHPKSIKQLLKIHQTTIQNPSKTHPKSHQNPS